MASTFNVTNLTKETPTWAKWLFRITLGITTVSVFWVAGTTLIADAAKVEVMLGLKTLDAAVYTFSKMFGVKVDEDKQGT